METVNNKRSLKENLKEMYNNAVEVLGRVENVVSTTVTKRSGETMPKKEVVIILDNPQNPQFAQRLKVDIIGETANVALRAGDTKVFHLNFKAYDYNAKCYNNITVWRVANADGSTVQFENTQQQPQPQTAPQAQYAQQAPQSQTPFPQQGGNDFEF